MTACLRPCGGHRDPVGSGNDLRRYKGAGGVGLAVEDRHAGVLIDDDDLGVGHKSPDGIEHLAANRRIGVLGIRHAQRQGQEWITNRRRESNTAPPKQEFSRCRRVMSAVFTN